VAGAAADFPPAWTIYYWVAKWQAGGSTETMHDQLRDRVRQVAGRNRVPSAAIIDSQSVKAAEEVARSSRGYDAGKKINGRKRHIAVDTTGLLLTVLITAASVQDRDAARPLLWHPAQGVPRDQARLGRRRLRRQACHLVQDRAQAHPGNRETAR
jgi:transposase